MGGGGEFLKISRGGSDSRALRKTLEASDSWALHSRAVVAFVIQALHCQLMAMEASFPSAQWRWPWPRAILVRELHFMAAPLQVSLCTLIGQKCSYLSSTVECAPALKALLDFYWMAGGFQLPSAKYVCGSGATYLVVPPLVGHPSPGLLFSQVGTAHEGKLSKPRPHGGSFSVPWIPHAIFGIFFFPIPSRRLNRGNL